MTALIDLKAHLNIVGDDTDDALLTAKIASAEAHTTNVIAADVPLTYDAAPADLKQAILMLAAHWYENREATIVGVSSNLVPFGYQDLVVSHRKWFF